MHDFNNQLVRPGNIMEPKLALLIIMSSSLSNLRCFFCDDLILSSNDLFLILQIIRHGFHIISINYTNLANIPVPYLKRFSCGFIRFLRKTVHAKASFKLTRKYYSEMLSPPKKGNSSGNTIYPLTPMQDSSPHRNVLRSLGRYLHAKSDGLCTTLISLQNCMTISWSSYWLSQTRMIDCNNSCLFLGASERVQ